MTPADESVTPEKLSAGGPKWNTSGDVYISGIATANNGLIVGVGLTLGDNVKLNLGASDDLQLYTMMVQIVSLMMLELDR